MTTRQFTLLLGLVTQTSCMIYEDGLRRETMDGLTDAAHEPAAAIPDAVPDGRPFDVLRDVEASRDAEIDVRDELDAAPGDVSDAGAADTVDARDMAADAVVDAVGTPEASIDVQADVVDAARDGGVIDAQLGDAASDPVSDPPIVGCTVDFNVSGVGWDAESAVDAGEGGARAVRLVGDIGTFGAWSPAAGLVMTEKAPGAWSTNLWLTDRLIVEFKFVKTDGAREPEWEQWLPFDSNRSFRVDCSADGGPIWVDAATDAGPANRAVGRSYGGAFGMRPLDATK